jgi:heme-degrading monooxygenase HmoA
LSAIQESLMITAIVRFPLSSGLSSEDVKKAYEHSAPQFRGAPGFVRKYYLHGVDGTRGGVYLWESREAAEAMYSDDWRQRIAEHFGAPPMIECLDTPLIIDNAESAG